MQFLLEQPGIDVNNIDRYGSRALHYAIRRGNYDIFQILFANPKVDPCLKDLDEISPLYESIMSEQSKMTALLLRRREVKVSVNDIFGEDQITPLALACSMDDGVYLDLLLKASMTDPNVVFGGRTALLYAIEKKSKHIKTFLACKEVDINKGTESTEAPVHLAFARKDTEILNLLLCCDRIDINKKALNGNTPLINSVNLGEIDIFNTILAWPGVLINEQGQDGMTALHAACEGGRIEMVDALLKQPDIQVNIRNSDGVSFSFIERRSTLLYLGITLK